MGLERDPEDLVSITIEGKFIGRVHKSSRFFISFKLSDSDDIDHSHLTPVAEKLTENLRFRRSSDSLEGNQDLFYFQKHQNIFIVISEGLYVYVSES